MNHLSTDDKVATEVAIPVVDTGTGPARASSVADGVPSFQQFLDYQNYCDKLKSVGFLNVCVGVNHVQMGLDLLGPAQKS